MLKKIFLFFVLLNQLNAKIINDLSFKDVKIKNLKNHDDVTFMIIDFKYKQGAMKICEFGAGRLSGFVGIDRIKHAHYMEELFGKALAELNLPVSIVVPHKEDTDAAAQPIEYAQHIFSDVEQLHFTNNATRSPLRNIKHIAVAWPATKFRAVDSQKLGKGILLDRSTYPFAVNKLLTHLLFEDDHEVKKFRPDCCIVETKYEPGVAAEILKKIKSPLVVVKPMNGWKGSGVIVCQANELDGLLKNILADQNKLTSPQLRYWVQYKQPVFLVESYESSDPFIIKHKTYDPTMRVALVMWHLDGKTGIKVLDGYWKMPVYPLESTGSLCGKTISHISLQNEYCSALVKKSTLEHITTLINQFMPRVYKKMMSITMSGQLKDFFDAFEQDDVITANQ